MKRTLLLIFTALGVAVTASAQHLDLSVNGGIGIPTGNFSKGEYAAPASGFAKTGGHFNLTGTVGFGKHFGITALTGYTRFGFKGAQSLADGYKEDSGTDSTTLVRRGNSSMWSFLAGPSYNFGLCKKVTVNVRALGGYTRTHLAGFSVFYEDYTDNTMSQREASGGAFGWQAGVGLAYHITGNWSVQVNGDYFMTKPDISVQYDNFIVNSGRRLEKYNSSIGGIHATVGLSYRLF